MKARIVNLLFVTSLSVLTVNAVAEDREISGKWEVHQLQFDKLVAASKIKTDEYQRRPRKSYIGTLQEDSVKETYYLAVLVKIKRCVTTLLPPEIVELNRHRSMGLYLEIAANGRLGKSEIRDSSGSVAFDQAAMDVIHRCEPYQYFPVELRKSTDVLVVSRKIDFVDTSP